MPQYLSFERETINPGALEIYRQRIGEILAGRDPMEAGDRKVRVADTDAVPFTGPRGGTRPLGFHAFRDDVCEDGDAEEAFILAIDLRQVEGNLPEPDDDDEDWGEEEWPMFIGGMPLDEYIALRTLDHVTVNGKPLTEWRDDAVCEEIEIECDDVEDSDDADEPYSRIASLGWRGGMKNLARRKVEFRTDAPHDRQRERRLRDAAFRQVQHSKQELCEKLLNAYERWCDAQFWPMEKIDDLDAEEGFIAWMEDVYSDYLWSDYDFCHEESSDVAYAILDLAADVETVRALWVDDRLKEAIGVFIDARTQREEEFLAEMEEMFPEESAPLADDFEEAKQIAFMDQFYWIQDEFELGRAVG